MKISFTNLLIILCGGVILSSCNINKKFKTVYYDKSWVIIKNSKNAEYFRTIQNEKDSLGRNIYFVKDFYKKDSTLQMSGYYLKNLNNRNGLFTWYYDNKNKMSEGFYLNNKSQGVYKHWYKSGKIENISYFKDDIIYKYKLYYENDSVHVIVDSYVNYQINGQLLSFHPNGKILRIENYDNGTLLNSKCFNSLGEDTTYYPHLIYARFPGGDNAFTKFIDDNLIFPIENNLKNIDVKVEVEVTVKVNGDVINPVVINSTNRIYNKEAIKVISKFPKWIPSTIDGVPYEDEIIITIYFKL